MKIKLKINRKRIFSEISYVKILIQFKLFLFYSVSIDLLTIF